MANSKPTLLRRTILRRTRRCSSTLVVYFPHCGMGDTIVFQAIIAYWHARCRAMKKRLVACVFPETGCRSEYYTPTPDEIWVIDPFNLETDASPESVLQNIQRFCCNTSMVWYKPYTYPDSTHERILSVEPYAELGRLASSYSIFPTFRVQPSAMEEAAAELAQCGIDAAKTNLVAIHCRGKRELYEKNPDPLLVKEVIDLLRSSHGIVPVLIGREDIPEVLQQAGAVSWPRDDTLQKTAALLKLCRVFIGGDSGPGHLAAAVGVPVVSIQNPVRVGFHWGPFCPLERLSWVAGTQAPAPAAVLLFDVEEVYQSASRFLLSQPCE